MKRALLIAMIPFTVDLAAAATIVCELTYEKNGQAESVKKESESFELGQNSPLLSLELQNGVRAQAFMNKAVSNQLVATMTSGPDATTTGMSDGSSLVMITESGSIGYMLNCKVQ